MTAAVVDAERLVTPTGVLVGVFRHGSPEWLAARRHGIGGSEVAAVLGLSPWDSRFNLWHRKRGLIPDPDLTDVMEWGQRLEPVVLKKWFDNHPGYQPRMPGTGTFANVNRPWQIANPDCLAFDSTGTVLVEVKTGLHDDEWGEPGTDQVPVYYRCQVLWYLDALGLSVAHIPVLFSGHDYREYVVHADEKEQAWIREQVKDFLDDVDTGTRPDIDTHTATYQAVRELHPEITGLDCEVPIDVADAWIAATDKCRRAEAVKRGATASLADVMGKAKYATRLGERIARRQCRRNGIPYVTDIRQKGDHQ